MKRALDIGTSALLLLLALPSLVIAALVIRLTSRGPIFFRQVRMGRDFKPFEILKLRTMEYAAQGLPYTLGADPRITPFGRFLRRSKLDEVPQLWNVLRGDMSLVGPRPVLPELTEEFRAQYARLLKVRPGLTDPASLKYSQEAKLLGTVPDPMGFFKTVVTPDKIAISLRYVERSNLWTDGVTLALTALICCFPSLSRLSGALVASDSTKVLPWRVSPIQAVPAVRFAPVRKSFPGVPSVTTITDRRFAYPRPPLPWNPAWHGHQGQKSSASRAAERASRL